jgi:hypothetical protein
MEEKIFSALNVQWKWHTITEWGAWERNKEKEKRPKRDMELEAAEAQISAVGEDNREEKAWRIGTLSWRHTDLRQGAALHLLLTIIAKLLSQSFCVFDEQ